MKVAAFYQFQVVDDPAALGANLRIEAHALGLKGTLIVASEGINGTLSGEAAAIDAFVSVLRHGTPCFDGLELKFSTATEMPFGRLKVKVKPEIVTLGDPRANPALVVGTYVAPADWNALLADPDVILIDTRNNFEVARGSFPGAIDPQTTWFGEFPVFVDRALNPAVHRKVAMFCTGGIRCEKASSLLRQQGFEEVYHLKGGILAYLDQISEADSLWQGECFVFDKREALGIGLVVSESTES